MEMKIVILVLVMIETVTVFGKPAAEDGGKIKTENRTLKKRTQRRKF